MVYITTTEIAPNGYKVLGLVSGYAVHATSIYTNFASAFAGIVGTPVERVKKLFGETQRLAIQDLEIQAQQIGATHIVGLRIDVSELQGGERQGLLVVAAYGTALRKESRGGKRKKTRKSKYNI